MRKFLLILPILVLAVGSFFYFKPLSIFTGAPPYHVAPDPTSEQISDELSYLKDWKRPEGPPKVALQVGHWQNDEVPEELKNLRGNTGASGGGKSEWEVNYQIANLAKDILEEQGIVVELLPATVPQDYWADVFVAIHADGNPDPTKTGYKAATPRRDLSGNAQKLISAIEKSYGEATGMVHETTGVTRNMRGYYAFSWWRYDHAVHPMTTSLILETGFLTSPGDREIIVSQPELSATGLSTGLLEYLKSEGLLKS